MSSMEDIFGSRGTAQSRGPAFQQQRGVSAEEFFASITPAPKAPSAEKVAPAAQAVASPAPQAPPAPAMQTASTAQTPPAQSESGQAPQPSSNGEAMRPSSMSGSAMAQRAAAARPAGQAMYSMEQAYGAVDPRGSYNPMAAQPLLSGGVTAQTATGSVGVGQITGQVPAMNAGTGMMVGGITRGVSAPGVYGPTVQHEQGLMPAMPSAYYPSPYLMPAGQAQGSITSQGVGASVNLPWWLIIAGIAAVGALAWYAGARRGHRRRARSNPARRHRRSHRRMHHHVGY